MYPCECFQERTSLPTSLLFMFYCLSSSLAFLSHAYLDGRDKGGQSYINICYEFIPDPPLLLFPLESLSVGCKNCPEQVVPSLQSDWVIFYMWQTHGGTFCCCIGLDVDWRGTNSNSILYSQSSTKPYSSLGGKVWTEGLEKLRVSEWVLIFNSTLIHLRGRGGRPWVVQSLWGVSDTLKAFLPSSVAVPRSNRNRGLHRKLLSFKR